MLKKRKSSAILLHRSRENLAVQSWVECMSSVSIVIVSWNVAEILTDCLTTILASPTGPACEIIVIDSASTDETVSVVRQRFPQVKLTALTENVGFVRGNNCALAQAAGEYVLLLNPDTRVLGDAIGEMARYLDQHPQVGIVGPQTLNEDGSHQSTRRRFPTLLTGMFESTWLQAYAPRAVLHHYYALDIPDDVPAADVDWVQGSALMLRRSVYDQIGGLDEGFSMYSEELDWCKRARAAGWRVVYLGQARIVHLGGKSSQQAEARTQIAFQTSKLRYFRKHHGWAAARVIQGVLALNYLAQIGLESAKGLLGHKRELRWQRVRMYWQVLRSGLRIASN